MVDYVVLVAGSRSITDEAWVHKWLDKLLVNLTSADHVRLKIIQGKAKGPDTFARNWAIKNNHPYQDFPADWERHGKRAGFIRNKEMVDTRPDAAIIFWDRESPGSLSTLNLCQERRILYRVLYPDTNS